MTQKNFYGFKQLNHLSYSFVLLVDYVTKVVMSLENLITVVDEVLVKLDH